VRSSVDTKFRAISFFPFVKLNVDSLWTFYLLPKVLAHGNVIETQQASDGQLRGYAHPSNCTKKPSLSIIIRVIIILGVSDQLLHLSNIFNGGRQVLITIFSN